MIVVDSTSTSGRVQDTERTVPRMKKSRRLVFRLHEGSFVKGTHPRPPRTSRTGTVGDVTVEKVGKGKRTGVARVTRYSVRERGDPGVLLRKVPETVHRRFE